MSESIQFTDIKTKMLHIFDFTERLWNEYKIKHKELEDVMKVLNKVVPIVEKASKKQASKKSCKKEVDDVLQRLLDTLKTQSSRVDLHRIQPELEKLIQQQMKWKKMLDEEERLLQPAALEAVDLDEGLPVVPLDEGLPVVPGKRPPVVPLDEEPTIQPVKTPSLVQSPDFLSKIRQRRQISESSQGGRKYVSTQADLNEIHPDEIKILGTYKELGAKITKSQLEDALRESNLELCGMPVGDKSREHWTGCPTQGENQKLCRVKPSVDVSVNNKELPVGVSGFDGFCVKTKQALRPVTPEIPAHSVPQERDIIRKTRRKTKRSTKGGKRKNKIKFRRTKKKKLS